MIIKLIVEGGEMKPGPAIAQKIGPLGMNMGKIIQDVNKATEGFKGIKVPVEIDVNPKTKTFKVEVFSPPTSELLKKELGLDKGTGEHKKKKVANASIEQIISVAKTKSPNMLEKNLKAAVKSIIGSCGTLGILIESKEYKEIEQDIDEGKFDKEINSEKTQTSPEKFKELNSFFKQIEQKQEEAKKQEEAEKAAAEAAEEAEKAAKLAESEKTEKLAEETKEEPAAEVPPKKSPPKK